MAESGASEESDRLIVEPVREAGLLGLLAQWEPLDEDFPEIEDAPVRPERAVD